MLRQPTSSSGTATSKKNNGRRSPRRGRRSFLVYLPLAHLERTTPGKTFLRRHPRGGGVCSTALCDEGLWATLLVTLDASLALVWHDTSSSDREECPQHRCGAYIFAENRLDIVRGVVSLAISGPTRSLNVVHTLRKLGSFFKDKAVDVTRVRKHSAQKHAEVSLCRVPKRPPGCKGTTAAHPPQATDLKLQMAAQAPRSPGLPVTSSPLQSCTTAQRALTEHVKVYKELVSRVNQPNENATTHLGPGSRTTKSGT